MKTVRWLLPLLSLALVITFSWWDVERSNAGPGPVHPAHAAVAALDGGANCAGCHADGQVSIAACLGCHEAIAAQGPKSAGFHAGLLETRCETCHPEHHGAEAPLIPPHAFTRGGLLDPDTYDHAHVAFELTGAHDRLRCEACHPHANAEHPPKGGRFVGLEQRCQACHEDPHGGACGLDCAHCHGQEQPFVDVPGFDHSRFPLERGHAEVACARCHDESRGTGIAGYLGAQVAVRACVVCHDDPHEPGPARGALQWSGAADCARCHSTDTWSVSTFGLIAHAEIGFPLHGPHATATCNSCHGDGAGPDRWQGAAPEPARCEQCHESPHSDKVMALTRASASTVATGCADCHLDTDESFDVGRISAGQHMAVGFALNVPHHEVACARCHQGSAREERYPGRAQGDCRVCHEDVHRGEFDQGGLDQGGNVRQCTVCHDEHRFAPHRFGAKAHAAVYPLTGAHDAVACDKCHPKTGAGVRRFTGVATDCKGCHDDVHGGRFDKRARLRIVAGRTGCARCHKTTAFTDLRLPFSHTDWTDHRLAGAHQQLACDACHNQPSQTDLGAVLGKTCVSCHGDPHGHQFDVGGATDCRRCHTEQRWTPAVFDHQKDSRYPLDATHRDVACGRCHQPEQVGDRLVTRYRPLGTKCSDCHTAVGTGRTGGK